MAGQVPVVTNGGQAVGLIPTRYPGSHQSEDSGIRLARKTEWQECDADVYLGLGQRMLDRALGVFGSSAMQISAERLHAADGQVDSH